MVVTGRGICGRDADGGSGGGLGGGGGGGEGVGRIPTQSGLKSDREATSEREGRSVDTPPDG